MIVATALAASGCGGNGDGDRYRVDAIFDNAGFLIAGQDVKIAGAKVGEVVDVRLTEDRRARIEMAIDRRFAPFRSDADCAIQPQSLIGEKFLQCEPGTTRGRPLTASDGRPPTVPLSNTHSPIDLDLVLGALRQPTTTRAAMLLSGLGSGLAGRAGDLNDAIRRADPAFGAVEELLTEVNAERATIRRLITDAERLVTTVDRGREDAVDFVVAARALTETTAARRAELRTTLQGVPPLLDAARPSLRSLQRLAVGGLPTVRELRAAAPEARRLLASVTPFVSRTDPTLRQLTRTGRDARVAVRASAGQVRRLRRLTTSLRPAAASAAALFESMREKGAVEGLQRFLYWGTAALSRFDSVSHILPAYLQAVDACNLYATVSTPGCSARFAAGGRTVTSRTSDAPAARQPKTGERPRGNEPPRRPAAPSAPSSPSPATPAAPGSLPDRLKDTVDGLLDDVGALLPGSGGERGGDGAPADGLLDYLLGNG